MKKLISKGVCYALVLSLVSSMTVPAFATEQKDNSNSGIIVNDVYYTDAEFQELLTYIEPLEDGKPTVTPRVAPASAMPAWAIGKWVIPAIGTIIITPVAISVGGKVIDSASQTFSNILNAVKKVVESKDKGDDGYKKPKSRSGKDKEGNRCTKLGQGKASEEKRRWEKVCKKAL